MLTAIASISEYVLQQASLVDQAPLARFLRVSGVLALLTVRFQILGGRAPLNWRSSGLVFSLLQGFGIPSAIGAVTGPCLSWCWISILADLQVCADPSSPSEVYSC